MQVFLQSECERYGRAIEIQSFQLKSVLACYRVSCSLLHRCLVVYALVLKLHSPFGSVQVNMGAPYFAFSLLHSFFKPEMEPSESSVQYGDESRRAKLTFRPIFYISFQNQEKMKDYGLEGSAFLVPNGSLSPESPLAQHRPERITLPTN